MNCFQYSDLNEKLFNLLVLVWALSQYQNFHQKKTSPIFDILLWSKKLNRVLSKKFLKVFKVSCLKCNFSEKTCIEILPECWSNLNYNVIYLFTFKKILKKSYNYLMRFVGLLDEYHQDKTSPSREIKPVLAIKGRKAMTIIDKLYGPVHVYIIIFFGHFLPSILCSNSISRTSRKQRN